MRSAAGIGRPAWYVGYVKQLSAFVFAGLCAVLAAAPALAQAHVHAPAATALPNLSNVKDEIAKYYGSGNELADVKVVVARAQIYVDRRVRERAPRPALVLDIDDTSLSTYPYERLYDFGFDATTWNNYASHVGFPAIAPTLHLVKHAKAEGVAVFYITGRREPQRSWTLDNLLRVGYPKPDGLFMRPVASRGLVDGFKQNARAAIASRGYTIVANIGDQLSDLSGRRAETTYKLPNPMYLIP